MATSIPDMLRKIADEFPSRKRELRDAADEIDRLRVELHQDGMETMNLRNELASLKQLKIPAAREFCRMKNSIRDARRLLGKALGE